jgi:hypothetical protein
LRNRLHPVRARTAMTRSRRIGQRPLRASRAALPLASSVSALALCFLITRAPATKERMQRRRVIMVLFGNEFDADEGAEVGGGLRGVEGDGYGYAVGKRRVRVC